MKQVRAMIDHFLALTVILTGTFHLSIEAQDLQKEQGLNGTLSQSQQQIQVPYNASYPNYDPSDYPYQSTYNFGQAQPYPQYTTSNTYQTYYQTQYPSPSQYSYQSTNVPGQVQSYSQYSTPTTYHTNTDALNTPKVVRGKINTFAEDELRDAEHQRLSNREYFKQQLQRQVHYQETTQPYYMRNQQMEAGIQDTHAHLQESLNTQRDQLDQFQDRQNNQQHIMHGYTQPQTYPQYYPTNSHGR